ncbi:MAG: MATE family efflux transporter, partial [Pseudomonadota bacterium]
SFLRMGTTGITAQAEGAGDYEEVTATLMRALVIAAVAGAILILSQAVVSPIAFWIIEGSAAVEASAKEYFSIRIWGAPAALANFAFLGWFIGMGRAPTAFVLQLLLNSLNAILDVWFVLGLELGVKGVAYGTVIAEVVAAGAGLWLALKLVRSRGVVFDTKRIKERDALRRMFAINRDIMIRTLSVLSAFSWFTAKSAEVSDVVLAANAILINLTHIATYFLDGFAYSAETLAGQAIGAKRLRQFKDAVRLSTIWAIFFSVLATLLFWYGGGVLIDFITVNDDVRATARTYLFWAAIAPIAGVMAYQLDGIFIGATRTADMRNMMLLSLILFFLLWGILTPLYGNHGLWASLIIFLGLRALTLGARYPALVRSSFPASQ